MLLTVPMNFSKIKLAQVDANIILEFLLSIHLHEHDVYILLQKTVPSLVF